MSTPTCEFAKGATTPCWKRDGETARSGHHCVGCARYVGPVPTDSLDELLATCETVIAATAEADRLASLTTSADDDRWAAAAAALDAANEAWREYRRAVSHDVLAPLLRELQDRRKQVAELQARLKLVDYVCHSHHASSLCTWEGVCPVCADVGGVDFYLENSRLYRPTPDSTPI